MSCAGTSNLTTGIVLDRKVVTADHNLIIKNPAKLFVYHEGEIEIDSGEQKESEVGREATEAPRWQATDQFAKDPPEPASNTAVETEPEKRSESLQQADGRASSATVGWFLTLVAASLLAVAWLMWR